MLAVITVTYELRPLDIILTPETRATAACGTPNEEFKGQELLLNMRADVKE